MAPVKPPQKQQQAAQKTTTAAEMTIAGSPI
jgi:hypothetical protein